MPDSATIGGVSVRFTSFKERPREYRGESVRTFDNTLQSGRDLPVRTWDGVTDWMTPASEATLRAAVEAGNVVCDDLVFYGESILCEVSIEDAPRGPDVQSGPTDYTAVNVTLSMVMREVSPAGA
jgi:hypothetical protein